MRKKIASMVFLSMVLVLSGCARQEATRGKDLTIELTDQEKSETTDLQINHVDDSKQINEVESGSYQSAEKKGILISIDPGHQSPQVDMSSKEPNAPGSDVMKTKATGGTSGRYSGLAEYELNLEIALQLREKLEVQGYDVIMTRENNETAISNAERARLANEVDPVYQGKMVEGIVNGVNIYCERCIEN